VNQLQDATITDSLGQTAEQALVMNSVEELGKINIDRGPVPLCEVSFSFGDRSLCAATTAKTMTAVVESWFKDGLQNLENRLLNDPIHDIGNS
jgi:hypothetical protein